MASSPDALDDELDAPVEVALSLAPGAPLRDSLPPSVLSAARAAAAAWEGAPTRLLSRPLHAPEPTPAQRAALAAHGDVLFLASTRGDAVGLGAALERGGASAANARAEEGGETPLHLAADAGDAAILSLLLGAGADVDAVEAEGGQTPLHYACAQGHWGVATALLAAGAAAGVVDADGKTAWDYARVGGAGEELLARLSRR